MRRGAFGSAVRQSLFHPLAAIRYRLGMQPAAICMRFLGPEKIEGLLTQMSSPQLKAVLKSGGIKSKLPGGIVSQQKRKRSWASRIVHAVSEGSDETASEFLQQWLLHHRRQMLIDYLDRLGVRHTAGETDRSFLLLTDAERARAAAAALLDAYPRDEAAAYLTYVAYQQKATVFDDWSLLDLERQPESSESQ